MTKFFWGNSVSSMQTEGGWNEGGKSLSVYDVRKIPKDMSDWKFANDNYHHYLEDFDLMQDLGMNMYRFQTSWSRCIVDGDGEINEVGMQYYDRFIDELIARGIEPMICLYHFDMPLHLAQQYNGFLSKHVLSAFVRYSQIMIDRFGDKVHYWLSFNEQNLYSTSKAFRISGYLQGQKTDEELFQIQHNVMAAHAMVCNYLHKQFPNDQIGGMLAYSLIYPATCQPEDNEAARQVDEFVNVTLLDAFVNGQYSPEMMHLLKIHEFNVKMTDSEMHAIAIQHNDFIAFSYYRSQVIDAGKVRRGIIPNRYLDEASVPNPFLKKSQWGWEIDPEGFRIVLNKIYQRYQIPVFPIENGIGAKEEWNGKDTIDDTYRIDYHRAHIQAMFTAMEEDGVPVLGYLGWGLIDILSSQGDMAKRYGMIYVNRDNKSMKDMKRVPKRSYAWFKNVIHTNGLSLRNDVRGVKI